MILAGIAVVVIVVLLITGFVLYRKQAKKPLKTDFYQNKWKTLQGLLRDKTMWSQAILDADKLLETALKKRHIRGRTMGERLVRAQRLFTDNDSVWFSHKLRNKLDSEPQTKLKESEVKQALLGFRQALKDVGALPNGQPTSSK